MQSQELSRSMFLSWEIQPKKKSRSAKSLTSTGSIVLNDQITIHYLLKKHIHGNYPNRISLITSVYFLISNQFQSQIKFTIMELIGRITKNAVVNQLKDERKVVNFNLAVNDYYKSRDSGIKELSTFINCSFWRSLKISEWLTKGSLVKISGRIYASAYIDSEGNAKATLNCHVNSIKIHSFGKKDNVNLNKNPAKVINMQKEEIKEDLPF